MAGVFKGKAGIDSVLIDGDDSRIADAIAADPAFAALEASGAPILAGRGHPLRIFYLNAAARDIFGDAATATLLFDRNRPAGAHLDDLAAAILHNTDAEAGPRLERSTLMVGGESRRVTLMCRKLGDAAGAGVFVLAALGLRPAVEAEPPTVDELRARFAARFGASAIRFLWKTDADDRFVAIDAALADVVGPAAADIVGASVEKIAQQLGGGRNFTKSIASRLSWSGVTVDWPFADGSAVAPVTLGALPIVDRLQTFAGYNGYGLVHVGRIRTVENPRIEKTAPRAANVVPLRPAQPIAPRQEPAPAIKNGAAEQQKLSEHELSAFAEIARTLSDDKPLTQGTAPTPASAIDKGPGVAATPEPLRALTTALDLLPIGVLVARGTHTLFVNRALLAELGYADPKAFVAGGGLARVFMGRSSMAAGGLAGDIEPQVETIDWDGVPATMISLQRAPLPRERSTGQNLEIKLARARSDNAMLRAVIDALDGAVAIVDDAGRIESATEAFAALLGAEKGDFDGLALSSLTRPEDASGLMTRLQLAEKGKADSFAFVPRNATCALQATVARLSAPGDKIYMRLEAHAPASMREQNAARSAAEQASAAKSAFLARISHEIRTPLNAIVGFAEVMAEERFGPVGSERYKDYLKDILASGRHVLSLVNDLLDLSKIEAGKLDLAFAPVDANAVIAECVSIMQLQANHSRIVMRQALAPVLPPIRADVRALRQILLNLLSNAIKFTQSGGQVIVSSAFSDAGYVLIRVKDTGVGMTDEEVRLALEPFTQIAPVSDMRGTGLGLPLTKALVEASHASFTIRSGRQEGTLVEIAFPLPELRAAE